MSTIDLGATRTGGVISMLVLTFLIFPTEIKSDCSPSPCANGAVCLDASLSPGHVCLCPPRFSGLDCSIQTNLTCQYNLYNVSGTLTSPNYPDTHGNYEECLYHIRVPSAFSINITVTFFHTELYKDVLSFSPEYNRSDTREFSGNLSCPFILSYPTNQVLISWFADFNIIKEGWRLEYESAHRIQTTNTTYINSRCKPFNDVRSETNVAGIAKVTYMRDIDDCASNPCLNSGVCVDGRTSGYTCLCTSHWSGLNCDVRNTDPQCLVNPCRNGAKCVAIGTDYECICRPGFTGLFCSIAISKTCDVSMCNGNGVCIVTEQHVRLCRCNSGYNGEFCETVNDPCSSHQCQHDATCLPTGPDNYMCICVEGYESQFCHLESNECASSPCANGGTCLDQLNSFTCTCVPNYSGELCDTYLLLQGAQSPQHVPLRTEWVVFLILLALLILLLVCLLVLCCYWKRNIRWWWLQRGRCW